MSKTAIIWTIIVIIVVVGLIIWANMSGQVSAPMPIGTSTVPASNDMVVVDTANDPTIGNFLVASNGMTLYEYANDSQGTSTCNGQCAATWPPYTVTVSAGTNLIGGTNATGTISTITRADDSMQVTYNGMPLYYYSKDVNPGDLNGQGVAKFWTVGKP